MIGSRKTFSNKAKFLPKVCIPFMYLISLTGKTALYTVKLITVPEKHYIDPLRETYRATHAHCSLATVRHVFILLSDFIVFERVKVKNGLNRKPSITFPVSAGPSMTSRDTSVLI